MNFETPGRLPPLGRVRHHFRAPFGAFFSLVPGRPGPTLATRSARNTVLALSLTAFFITAEATRASGGNGSELAPSAAAE